MSTWLVTGLLVLSPPQPASAKGARSRVRTMRVDRLVNMVYLPPLVANMAVSRSFADPYLLSFETYSLLGLASGHGRLTARSVPLPPGPAACCRQTRIYLKQKRVQRWEFSVASLERKARVTARRSVHSDLHSCFAKCDVTGSPFGETAARFYLPAVTRLDIADAPVLV